MIEKIADIAVSEKAVPTAKKELLGIKLNVKKLRRLPAKTAKSKASFRKNPLTLIFLHCPRRHKMN